MAGSWSVSRQLLFGASVPAACAVGNESPQAVKHQPEQDSEQCGEQQAFEGESESRYPVVKRGAHQLRVRVRSEVSDLAKERGVQGIDREL